MDLTRQIYNNKCFKHAIILSLEISNSLKEIHTLYKTKNRVKEYKFPFPYT